MAVERRVWTRRIQPWRGGSSAARRELVWSRKERERREARSGGRGRVPPPPPHLSFEEEWVGVVGGPDNADMVHSS